MRDFIKKEIAAFITVECSFLLSVIIIVYAFIVGFSIYFYNQCILHSNIGILAVEGASVSGEDTESIIKELQEVENRLYKEKYFLIEMPQIELSVSDNIICIEGNGKVNNPIFHYGIGKSEWEISAQWDIRRNNPQKVLRLCKKISGLGEEMRKEGLQNE